VTSQKRGGTQIKLEIPTRRQSDAA
jgi:hypothetical protein